MADVSEPSGTILFEDQEDVTFDVPKKLNQSWDCFKAESVEIDDCSTAAQSPMSSPNGGPLDDPADEDQLGETVPGLALEELSSREAAAIVEEHSRHRQLQQQIEWHFSESNLSHDLYLRSLMDELGWVQLQDIMQLANLRSLNASINDALLAIASSTSVLLSADLHQVCAANPALRAAFAPRYSQESPGLLSPRKPVVKGLIEEADVPYREPDEAMMAGVQSACDTRASKEGAPWPCTEWLTSDPFVSEACLEWLLSDPDPHERMVELQPPTTTKIRRRQTGIRTKGGGKPPRSRRKCSYGRDVFHIAFDSEIELALESPTSAAWTRFSDDSYPSPAASLMWW